jgi:hypothetical protein
MQEIYRVLKPGGFAIIQVPFFAPLEAVTFEDNSITNKRERERIFGQDDHVRKYGTDYPQRIAKSGLHPEEEKFAFTLPPDILKKFGLGSGEIIYIGRK